MEPVGEHFAFQKLHRDEVDIPMYRRSSVDFEYLAHVGMADGARVPHFRGQAFTETSLGAFDGDPPLQPLIESLVDDTHATLRHFAHDPKAAIQQYSRLKRMLEC